MIETTDHFTLPEIARLRAFISLRH